MRKLTSTRAEGTLISLFTMAEGDSSNSFSEAETDSMLSGSAYYSTEDSDTSSVASLSLPVPEEPAVRFDHTCLSQKGRRLAASLKKG